ncbi:hypothetical protein AFAE65S_03639 [Alcaligenes phenolicus]
MPAPIQVLHLQVPRQGLVTGQNNGALFLQMLCNQLTQKLLTRTVQRSQLLVQNPQGTIAQRQAHQKHTAALPGR